MFYVYDVVTMAIKQTTTLVDDLDGGDADRTVRFGFDGVDYEIDLAEANIEALGDALGPFLAAARRVSGSRRFGRSSARSTRPSPSRPAGKTAESNARPAAETATTAAKRDSRVSEIRAWAADNGFSVGLRGRIPEAVKQAWAEATGSKS